MIEIIGVIERLIEFIKLIAETFYTGFSMLFKLLLYGDNTPDVPDVVPVP